MSGFGFRRMNAWRARLPHLALLSCLLLQVASPRAEAPRPEDAVWRLPATPPYPADNAPTPARIELGKALFFDPRLSGKGDTSCATCHDPVKGWSDGRPTAQGLGGKTLPRATPTVYNAAYNGIQMWDGRKASLEDQAMGPLESPDEMAADFSRMLEFLRSNPRYVAMFEAAYPGQPIGKPTASRAIASFERTVVASDSPFDRWLAGDEQALNPQQLRGFRLFVDEQKGNCAACHQAPNFTDDGFHNLGLASFGAAEPDPGRYAEKPIKVVLGAFKTPTLRNVALTAPYFHDGSAATLEEVVEHYAQGGVVKTNLSPNMKALALSAQEKADLVAFLHALTGDPIAMLPPVLP